MSNKQKVFVGVSGGVDSSVALALLQKEGCDVTGVFLKVWAPDFLPCSWREERRSAMRVCATLGVPFLTLDCEEEYKRDVVDYMIREYSEGRVPNPDVFCNKYVKFGVFLKKAVEMGADYVATGHYATRYEYTNHANKTNVYELRESRDKEKDQSYFLYTLGQEQLGHTLFPVGGYTKPEVRKLAKKFNLPTAEKKDSQGLCFIGKVDMREFLSHYIKSETGKVLNTKGETIGEHPGAIFFAIGQRHGFDIRRKSPNDRRFFVISKSMRDNTITVADKERQEILTYTTKEVFMKNLHIISGQKPSFPMKTTARIRYRQNKQDCVVQEESGGYRIYFKEPQEGVSVGQSAVLYNGDVCLGGGIIESY